TVNADDIPTLPLDTQVLTPTTGIVLNSFDPVAISGVAHADLFLKTLTLYANADVIYTNTYPDGVVNDTTFDTTWTPSAHGEYVIYAVATDWADNTQSDVNSIQVEVATTNPTIAIDPLVITTTQQIGTTSVAFGGTVTALGSSLVEVQVNSGDYQTAGGSGTS